MQLGTSAVLDPSAEVVECSFGRYTAVHEKSKMRECSLGDYSYVMENCDLIYAEIGKFCSIASNVRINPGNHPLWRASSHHFTYRSEMYGFAAQDDAAFFEWRRNHKVTIGHDVWIGHGAIVMPGVTIGTGAAIGSGAIVTKDVAPYTIVAGVPARMLRQRFAPDIATGMIKLGWWDWPHDRIEAALLDFRELEPAAFLSKYGDAA
jgi:phosphonate metabolism protein (transferase hexapeptide repeat family)